VFLKFPCETFRDSDGNGDVSFIRHFKPFIENALLGESVVNRFLKVAHCRRVHLVDDGELTGVASLVFGCSPAGVTLPPVLHKTDLAVRRGRAIEHIHLTEEIQIARYKIHASASPDATS
jgi:hypothetical protein